VEEDRAEEVENRGEDHRSALHQMRLMRWVIWQTIWSVKIEKRKKGITTITKNTVITGEKLE
jgi:hypothetical protein